MEKLLPQLVNLNLKFVQDTVIPQIGIPLVETSANLVLENLKQTVIIVTDENPNNPEQLKQLWSSFTSKPEMALLFEESFMLAVNKIQDKTTREALTLLTPEIVKTLVAVSDNVKPDGEQIELIWKNFGRSPKFIAFLLSNLSTLVSRLPLPNWLKAIINSLKV